MKNLLLVCALGSALLAVAPAAHADETYSLTFSGCFTTFNCQTPFSDDGNVQFTVSGTPTEPGPGFFPNAYTITDISGGMTIGGNDYTIGTLSNHLGGDNELDLYHNGTYDFDLFGLDFTLSTTTSGTYNEFRIFGPFVPGAEGQYTADVNVCTGRGKNKTCAPETVNLDDLTFDIQGSIDPAPAPTPEPGSLALLGTSILGGAGVLRRRFRA
ncbi:MAG TPA: PEP-CTERM sorting domain-containing protein [Acidobacteriaceae bacterium]|jgi:hypothetical protein